MPMSSIESLPVAGDLRDFYTMLPLGQTHSTKSIFVSVTSCWRGGGWHNGVKIKDIWRRREKNVTCDVEFEGASIGRVED